MRLRTVCQKAVMSKKQRKRLAMEVLEIMEVIMKKLYWKRMVIAAAAVLMGIQIAGCGGTQEVTTASKEFVYVPEYQEITLEEGIWNANVIGDTVYFLTGASDEAAGVYKQYIGALKIGEKEPELMELELDENASLSSFSSDTDGNLIGIVNTDIYEETAGTESEADGEETEETKSEADGEETGGEDTAETANTAEGKDSRETADTESEDDLAEENSEGTDASVTTEEISGSTVVVGGSGAMTTTSSPVYAGSSYGEEYQMPISQKTELYKFSTKGEILSKTDLAAANLENPYVQYFVTDKAGNIYLGLDQSIKILDKDGKEKATISVDTWIHNMFATKDGEVLISYYGTDRMEIHKIDIDSKKIGDEIEGITSGQWGNYTFAKGIDTDLLYSVNNELFSYNFDDTEPKRLLSWIDSDIDSDSITTFAPLEDGRILVITSNWNDESGVSTTEFIYLTKKKGSEVPEKKIITLGTLSLGYDTRKMVIDFNKKNQECRIEVKEYFTDHTSEDGYSLAMEQMNTDIISGKGPDIIDVSSGNQRKYSSKGILEDIYLYIDEDPELNREDYLENVLRAFEMDGKLYSLPSRIYINTSMAKVSDVGERNSITLEELMDIMDNLPEDTLLYEYAVKDSILMTNIMMNMDQYVNWETGECNFNTDNFMKAMEFANRFDTDYDFESSSPGTATLIREGKLLIMEGVISSVQQYQAYSAMFGEPISFIGYPTTADNGSFLGSAGGSLLCINSKSKNKEEAWQFIRKGITKEEQEKTGDGRTYGFPIMKSALEKQFEEDSKEEYYETPDGGKERQAKTTWGYDNFTVEIYAATEDEIDAVRELIERTDKLYEYDEQMYNIIKEETQGYFEGQKTAKEVADIIQSRIQIYVNENR